MNSIEISSLQDHALLEFLIAKLQYSSDGGKKMLTHDRVASEIE